MPVQPSSPSLQATVGESEQDPKPQPRVIHVEARLPMVVDTGSNPRSFFYTNLQGDPVLVDLANVKHRWRGRHKLFEGLAVFCLKPGYFVLAPTEMLEDAGGECLYGFEDVAIQITLGHAREFFYLCCYPPPEALLVPDAEIQAAINVTANRPPTQGLLKWFHGRVAELRQHQEIKRQQLLVKASMGAQSPLSDTTFLSLAGVAPQAVSCPEPPPKKKPRIKKGTLDERAYLTLAMHPEWTLDQIAEAIGCNAKSLSKPGLIVSFRQACLNPFV